ncbi:glycine/D-amino acid oxidase-like deaminating enzyme [Motilibacter peucedani]|uniref:Glycine/D-amino acid oxidase-like deaminating enzyme n=1 Tax=Motilibacter peucedani TaxID=598650 RepID=A0A420XN61_9ACTN|nr:FAD-binding oxidoreductase [Motilibacter peucedani]RKS72728.1 glycine/D-amino acid oxidase-like deaminating enzyme [Motilibacter peucedani]
MTTTSPYAGLSLWHATLDDDYAPRPALAGDLQADVAIVGAGFTGLWTAYYLAHADPGLRIVVLEKEVAGFGASGRNGGWCSALFPASWSTVARRSSAEAARSLAAAMRDTVDEVVRVAHDEGIDDTVAKGGTVVAARTPVQLERAREHAADARTWHDDVTLLSAAETQERVTMTGVLGGTWTPDCAVVHPARLVRGLARAVERLGVTVHEQTEVTALEAGSVRTSRGTVHARFVVRATEGFTARLDGHRRDIAPVYSLMVATEPLPQAVWEEVGLAGRETFSDYRHLIIYGQRTADGRLAFGGRGAPYHFGSAVRPGFDTDGATHAALEGLLRELFPAVRDAAVTHRWGGPLGIPRDWYASVGLDPATGLGWAGGYVGDGVGTANLAGRTLADLVLGRSTALTRLPWVGHRSPRWEPEPLRWLGVNAGLRAMTFADTEERLTGRASVAARVFGRLTGH